MKTYRCNTECYGFLSKQWLPGEEIEVDEEAEQDLLKKHGRKFDEVEKPSSVKETDELRQENQTLRDELDNLKNQMDELMRKLSSNQGKGKGRN